MLMDLDKNEAQLLKQIKECKERGDFVEFIHLNLKLAQKFPAHSNLLIASKNLQTMVPKIEREDSKTQKIKIALLYSSTSEWVKDYLYLELIKENFSPEIYQAPYNQMDQVLLNRNSEIYRFDPDLVFLHRELESLLPEGGPYGREEIPMILARIRSLVNPLLSETKALLVIHNFPVPEYLPIRSLSDLKFNSLREWFHELNSELAKEFSLEEQALVLDYDHLTSLHGKSRCTNRKLYYLGHFEMSESFLPVLVRKYTGYAKALKGKGRKCIVLDLDNTLWGGILGEDGFDAIVLSQTGPGREFYDFQSLLKEFSHRGILLAINSKNNFDEAMKVIREHPAMVLREGDFSAIRINWNDKISNMSEISKELKIGLDSLVFLDDDPRERHLMRQALKEVLTPEMPRDPSGYCEALYQLNDFEPISLTLEDTRRVEIYREEKLREKLKTASQSVEEYLYSLKLSARIFSVEEKELVRTSQLVQRTNQFNMTSHRYSLAELRQRIVLPQFRILAMSAKDIFGDNGTVGAALLEKEENSFWIRLFLLSCRILGRGLEEAFLNHIVSLAYQEKIDRLIGEVIFTEKNQPARDFYSRYGFKLLGEKRDDRTQWVYPIEGIPVNKVQWIQLVIAEKPSNNLITQISKK